MLHQDLNRAAFPTHTVRLGIGIMAVLTAGSMWLNWEVGKNLGETIKSEVEVVTAAQRVHDYGIVLEMTVKAATADGDPEAAAKYRLYQSELRKTLSDLRQRLESDGTGGTVAQVDQADLALVALEYEALEHSRSGRLEDARKLIEGAEYQRLIQVYDEGIRSVERSAAGYVQATHTRIERFRLWILLLSGASLALVIIGWFSFVRPTRRWGDQLDSARATSERAAYQLRMKQHELETLNERLFKQARIDPLTCLNTRLSFTEDAEAIWSTVDPAPNLYCAVMCDVDFFKQFNDSRGHLEGDRVLRLAADALKSAGNVEDRFYRMGGEEFLVVLKAASVEAAGLRADHLRQSIEALRLPHPDSPLGFITMSMGVAVFDRTGGMTVEEWLKASDQALYAAKSTGRNRVCLARELSAGERRGQVLRLAKREA